MADLKDLSGTQRLKVLLWGQSGAGKTCFLSQADGPIYCFDFDNKISSLASYLKERNPEKLGEVAYDSYIALNPKDRPLLRFGQVLSDFELQAQKGEMKVKTIALDSLTTFSDALMRECMIRHPEIKRAIEGIPAMQDYLTLTYAFKEVIARLLALPCDIVIMAHDYTEKDEHTGMLKAGPLLAGKLASSLPVVFPEIYRAFVEKDGKHVIQTRPDGRNLIRTQLPKIPGVVPNDFKQIRQYL